MPFCSRCCSFTARRSAAAFVLWLLAAEGLILAEDCANKAELKNIAAKIRGQEKIFHARMGMQLLYRGAGLPLGPDDTGNLRRGKATPGATE